MSEKQGEYVTDNGKVENKEKPLRCPECREVLGYVRRINGIRVFRIKAPLEGFMVEVTMDAKVWCTCGGLLYWHAGQEAIDALLEKMQRMKAGNDRPAEG